MKKFLSILILVSVLSGCTSYPKDAYVEKFEAKSVWVTISADVMATGTAAKNASLPDVLPPKPTKGSK